jgi:class 3 adenylate cyclase
MDGELRYAPHGDAHLAYRTWGQGPALLWLPSQFIPVMSMDDEPAYERFLLRLAGFGTVIAFDRLGIGLSDPMPPGERPTAAEWAAQCLSVLDAAEVERAFLVAHAGGGMPAVILAVRHAERVAGLISALAVSDYGIEDIDGEVLERVRSSARPGADSEVDFLAVLAPSRADDEGFRRWWNSAGQRGASPAVAQLLLEMQGRENVNDLVPEITVPTLALYRPDYATTWLSGNPRFAATVPGAHVVEVAGIDALPWLPDSDAVIAEIEDFVTGARRAITGSRALLAVMFTDVVGSTETAARLGDDRWRDLLETHDRVMRRHIERHGGTEIDTAGDGFLSTFATPSQAVQCAARLHLAMAEVGLQLRVGIHCGEVEVRGHNIAGMTVHLAARVQAKAEAATTFVTGTVRDAMVGSRLTFTDQGTHTLKGVPGEWPLYAVS